MTQVFVLGSNQKPLMPCSPARARELLSAGRAAVYRRQPFTIVLKDRIDGEVQPIQLKLDPGSKTTGIALVGDFKRGKGVLWAANLEHRGTVIAKKLADRRSFRSGRRNRKTRYRPWRPRAGEQNSGEYKVGGKITFRRQVPKDWIAPSMVSRLDNVRVWCDRLNRYAPLDSVSLEVVKFDTQKMENPEISGVEYQQGTLWGYEVKEYLLEKWGRRCVYCGAKDVPLQIEHIVPKSRGGSNRLTNLALSCAKCNQKKNTHTADEFGHPEVQKAAKKTLSMKDAAAVNTTRWRIHNMLVAWGASVECGSGGRTRYNRHIQAYSKDHWIDAACVGESGEKVYIPDNFRALQIKAFGRGARRVCNNDKYGFPNSRPGRVKRVHGFSTGDVVVATLPGKSKYAGQHMGVITSCRANGAFTINGKVPANWRYCRLIQRFDGYRYGIVSKHESIDHLADSRVWL